MKNISKKLVRVMEECGFIAKNGKNTFHDYKYATSEDVMTKVNKTLVKYGICSLLMPEIDSIVDVKNLKGNTEHLATVKVCVHLIDSESGESIDISGIGCGQDSGDKAVMKAQTAAIKYAYMLTLAIATGDDPEADVKTDKFNGERQEQQRKIEKISKVEKSANGFKCISCGVEISERVQAFSNSRFGESLCMECQKNHKAIA